MKKLLFIIFISCVSVICVSCKSHRCAQRIAISSVIEQIRNNDITLFYNQVVARNFGPGLETLVLLRKIKEDSTLTIEDGYNYEDSLIKNLRNGGIYILNKITDKNYINGRWTLSNDTLTLYPAFYTETDNDNETECYQMKTSLYAPIDTIVMKYIIGKDGLYDITDYTSLNIELGEQEHMGYDFQYLPIPTHPVYIMMPIRIPGPTMPGI